MASPTPSVGDPDTVYQDWGNSYYNGAYSTADFNAVPAGGESNADSASDSARSQGSWDKDSNHSWYSWGKWNSHSWDDWKSPSSPDRWSTEESYTGDERRSGDRWSGTVSTAQRYRGGQIPNPPHFDGDTKDKPFLIRTYKRETDTWLKLVKDFLPDEEKALRLAQNFSGKAKSRLYDRFNVAAHFGVENGVELLLAWIVEQFGEEEVVQVQARVDDFFESNPDKLMRKHGETMRDFVERFDATYERLKEVGESVTERSLCSRLLRKSGLSPKEQLNVIQEAGSDSNYAKLQAKLRMYSPYLGNHVTKAGVAPKVWEQHRKKLRQKAFSRFDRKSHKVREVDAHQVREIAATYGFDPSVLLEPDSEEEEDFEGMPVIPELEDEYEPNHNADAEDVEVSQEWSDASQELANAHNVLALAQARFNKANTHYRPANPADVQARKARQLAETKKKSRCSRCHALGH